MYGKKVKIRILFTITLFAIIILSIYLILKSLEENVSYFLSPSEIKNLSEINPKKIRVGGMVKKNSILANSNEINFEKLSKSLGFKKFYSIKSKKNLKKKVEKFLAENSLSFLEVKVSNSKIKKLPRPTNLIKIKKLFMM